MLVVISIEKDMNQILDTGDNKKRKKGSIKSRIRFFAIFLIIFAICAIGVAIYSIINNSGKKVNQKPEIELNENIEENILNIKITDDTGLKEIVYSLNGKETKLDGNSELQKDIILELSSGNNIVKIMAIDINGEQKEYEGMYGIGAEVNFAVEGNKVKVSITNINKMSYMTYRWNEEEETKEEIQDIEYELEIDLPKEEGKYKLTLIIVDENNNTTEKTKEVIIDKEPTLTVTRSNEAFIIKAEDDEKLKKAELTLNGEKLEDVEIDGSTWEYKVPFVEGINKLKVKVYNLNDATKEKKVMVDQSKLTNE